MKEKTLVLIKPEGIARLGFIRRKLAQVGTITASRMITLNEQALRSMYPGLRGELWDITARHLLGQQVAIFVVEGDDIIERVVEYVGYSFIPHECAVHTLRYQLDQDLGCKVEGLHGGEQIYQLRGHDRYYYNFLHRTKNTEEATQQIKMLMSNELVWFPL